MEEVSKLLGHESIKTTEKSYAGGLRDGRTGQTPCHGCLGHQIAIGDGTGSVKGCFVVRGCRPHDIQ